MTDTDKYHKFDHIVLNMLTDFFCDEFVISFSGSLGKEDGLTINVAEDRE